MPDYPNGPVLEKFWSLSRRVGEHISATRIAVFRIDRQHSETQRRGKINGNDIFELECQMRGVYDELKEITKRLQSLESTAKPRKTATRKKTAAKKEPTMGCTKKRGKGKRGKGKKK